MHVRFLNLQLLESSFCEARAWFHDAWIVVSFSVPFSECSTACVCVTIVVSMGTCMMLALLYWQAFCATNTAALTQRDKWP